MIGMAGQAVPLLVGGGPRELCFQHPFDSHRCRHRTARRRAAGALAALRPAPCGCGSRTHRHPWNQPAAWGFRRSVDRAAVHREPARRGTPGLRRHRGPACLGPRTHPQGRHHHAICALRQTRLACRPVALSGTQCLQRLLRRNRAGGHRYRAVYRAAIREPRRTGRGATRDLPDAVSRAHRGTQRHRTWPQDRSRAGIRLGTVAGNLIEPSA